MKDHLLNNLKAEDQESKMRNSQSNKNSLFLIWKEKRRVRVDKYVTSVTIVTYLLLTRLQVGIKMKV